jgi:hypothetical protein
MEEIISEDIFRDEICEGLNTSRVSNKQRKSQTGVVTDRVSIFLSMESFDRKHWPASQKVKTKEHADATSLPYPYPPLLTMIAIASLNL